MYTYKLSFVYIHIGILIYVHIAILRRVKLTHRMYRDRAVFEQISWIVKCSGLPAAESPQERGLAG